MAKFSFMAIVLLFMITFISFNFMDQGYRTITWQIHGRSIWEILAILAIFVVIGIGIEKLIRRVVKDERKTEIIYLITFIVFYFVFGVVIRFLFGWEQVVILTISGITMLYPSIKKLRNMKKEGR